MRILNLKVVIAVGFLISVIGCSPQSTVSSDQPPENQLTVSDQFAQNVLAGNTTVSPTPENQSEIIEKLEDLTLDSSKKDYEEIKKLLALKPNLDVRGSQNRTLLVRNMYGDLKTFKMLLEAGADPNFPSLLVGRETEERCLKPPMTIAFLDHNTEAMRLLIEHGADPNTGSALAGATERDYRDMVKMLIAHKADVNYSKDYGLLGSSPILFVKSAEVGKLLLAAGANINHQDESGQTALMYNISDEFGIKPDPKAEEERLKVVSFLIKNGADVNLKDKDGKTALQRALENKPFNTLIIKELQKAGAK